MTLTHSASLGPPERGHSLGLWGRPAWLFLLLSLPVLSCLPIFFPLAVFTFNAFQVDLSSQGFLPLTLCLPQCLASGSDCTGSEPDPRPAPLYPDLSGVESESGLPPPCFPESRLFLCSPALLLSSLPGPAVCMAPAASGERLTPSGSYGSASRWVPPTTALVTSCRPGTRSLGLCPGAAAAGTRLPLDDRAAEAGVRPGGPCSRPTSGVPIYCEAPTPRPVRDARALARCPQRNISRCPRDV